MDEKNVCKQNEGRIVLQGYLHRWEFAMNISDFCRLCVNPAGYPCVGREWVGEVGGLGKRSDIQNAHCVDPK